MMDSKLLYTEQEVADLCAVSTTVVRNWVNAGKLQGYWISKKKLRITKAALNEFLGVTNGK